MNKFGKTRLLTLPVAAILSTAFILGACGSVKDVNVNETNAQQGAPVMSALEAAIANPARAEKSVRDVYRHPKETIEFFQINPDLDVLEISPTGGYYADILMPYLATGAGSYMGTHFADNTGFFGKLNAGLKQEYPDMVTFPFSEDVKLPEGVADRVLTFRNLHNWMSKDWGENAFSQFYAALKPGGMLGIVEHRLPASQEQDPRAPTGYVQQAYTIALAEEAGFTFAGSSEVNANPKDTADHKLGVWMLPPRLRTENPGDDTSKYEAIGESDRYTLLFIKTE